MKPCNDGAHHYKLPPADGSARIEGRCVKCGHVRDWPASLEEESIVWSTNRLKHLFVEYDPARENTRLL